MRYIANPDTVLFTNDGLEKYRFRNGVLDLGTDNTIDTTLDPNDPGPALQRPYSEDLAGGTTSAIELCGQGDLATVPPSLRIFYEAPADVVDTILPEDGAWCQLLDGTFEYDGKTYFPGDKFKYVGSAMDTPLGTCVIALTLPPGPEVIDMDGQFHDKHLLWGDEPKDYWVKNEYGYIARNGLEAGTLPEGYNYTR